MMVPGEPSYKSAPRAVVVSTMATAALALGLSAAVHADDPRALLQRQTAALAAAEAREAERSRLARLRWASERRNSVAHARMTDTMYASTPNVAGELSCPVATEDDVRAALRGWDAGASNALGPRARQAALISGIFQVSALISRTFSTIFFQAQASAGSPEKKGPEATTCIMIWRSLLRMLSWGR